MLFEESGALMAYAWQMNHKIASRHELEGDISYLYRQGYRPIDVNVYEVNGADHYAAIWEKSLGLPWRVKLFLDKQEHQQQLEEFRHQGFRPVCVSACEVEGIARYASLWEQRLAGPAFKAFHHCTSVQIQSIYDTLRLQGFHPVDICGYVIAGMVLFTVIWEQSPMAQWEIRHDITESQFLAIHAHNINNGFMARRISGYLIGEDLRYAAIWEKRGHGNEPDITWESEHRALHYLSNVDIMLRRGYRLVKINGIGTPFFFTEPQFTTIWQKPYLSDDDNAFIGDTVQTFRAKHHIPGVSLALAYRGRLVLARGYGTADPAGAESVTINNTFRIASASKPITAVAIFKLIEARYLQLDQRVFGPNSILGNTYGTPQFTASGYKPNIDQITVQHLLEHTSGWPRSTDPMFRYLNLDQAGLITHMLDLGLSTIPGQIHDYLNFGYCVLGRIIEQVSGLSYADYVQQVVLSPCGIVDMHIAGDTLADRRGNEVFYFSQNIDPYSFRVSRMDAHGGWIASAINLVRFLVHVDGFVTKPDILSPNSISTMITSTTALTPNGDTTGYAKGWSTNTQGTRWHFGDLPGSASVIVRTRDQYCWAVLVNSRNDAQYTSMLSDLDQLMWTVVKRIVDWPAFDLF